MGRNGDTQQGSDPSRAQTAHHTLEILQYGRYTLPDGTVVSLGDSVTQSVQRSRHYAPDDFGHVFVPVIRDDEDQLLAVPYQVAMITAPAVNAGAVRANEPHNVPQIKPPGC